MRIISPSAVELVQVGVNVPGRPEQLLRERAREPPLADARRPVEEIGVHRPLDERGVEQPLRLVLLAKALELAHVPPPRSRRAAATRRAM